MPYIPLGRKKTIAVTDPTGLNTSNFSNVFDLAVLSAKVPFYEIYKVSVANGFPVATLTWYQNADQWDTVQLGGNASWDANQPLLMTPNDETYFCWNVTFSASTTPPVVTCWMRYDPTINPGIRS